MFDIGWSELLVIAVVAIVVVGPKDLPDMLRNLGRGMKAMRRMAADFQGQFNEALREAELDDVKNEFTKLRSSARDLTRLPDLQSIARDEIKSAIEGPNPGPVLPAALPEAQLPEMREPVIDAAPAPIDDVPAKRKAPARPRKPKAAKTVPDEPKPARKPRARTTKAKDGKA